MPPVRTESLNSAPPNELPYLIPARGITFAPNIAAETYNEPPELIVPPESTLFPSSNSSLNEVSSILRKSSHSKKRPDDWIPRPPNAFILFRSEFIKSQHVPGDVEANHGNLSKSNVSLFSSFSGARARSDCILTFGILITLVIGLCWRNLPFSERDVWECKARIAMAEHKAKYPNYRFRPTHKDREPSHRRRVKEPPPPPDEQRCAEIANLLVCGMKGEVLANKVRELDAIRPQDKTRMRFDEPVTPSTTNAFGSDKNNSLEKVEEQPLEDEGEKESLKEKRRRSSSAPVSDAALLTTGEGDDTKFIAHTPGRQPRRARTVGSTPSRNRAASSSPAKKRSSRSRGYSLRIETTKDGETVPNKDEEVSSRQIFVGVFRTNKDKKEPTPLLSHLVKETDPDDPSPPKISEEIRSHEDDSQAQEPATAVAVDQIGILSPPFTPSGDDVFSSGVDTYSWTQAATALDQQSAWTPNTPPASGQQTTSSWTPHTPNLQNLYLDSPLNSPNSNSPFMPAEQIYMPYTAPLTPERYASTQYPPQSPFPPPTPISPEFAAAVAPSIPTPATHAPIPRQPYIDIPNVTNEFFSEELLNEHMYNYAAEYGSGELDSAAESYDNNPTAYDSGGTHHSDSHHHLIFTREFQETLRAAASDLQLYRSSAVLVNPHHSHNHSNHNQIMGLSMDDNLIDINFKSRSLGDDTGAQLLPVAY